MAVVLIQQQPRGIVSTLLPIYYQFSQSAADTVNVIVQLQYDIDGLGNWTNWGGKLRCSPVIGVAGTFRLNASDMWNSLPKGNASQITGLGSGCCYGGGFPSLRQTQWSERSNWQVRLIVQREYLDATTGFIELDPDTTTSNELTVHEGSAPVKQLLWGGSYIDDAWELGRYLMQQNPTNATQGGWLWLTDALYTKRNYTLAKGNYNLGVIDTTIREDEQFLISTFNGKLKSGITGSNKLFITTFHKNGTPLIQRNMTWNGGETNKEMQTIDVGFRSIMCAFEADPSEGTDFSYVAEYEVVNMLMDSSNSTRTCPSCSWRFRIDRSCKGKGYQRFLWKNQLGGWDMHTSNGKLTSRRKMKHNSFTKRIKTNSINEYGKNNWLTTSDQVLKVESQPMKEIDAMWFSKIGASPFTYLRIDMQSKYNPQSFGNTDAFETWRDYGRCNGWIPIVVNSNSIKVQNTAKKLATISFEYQIAQPNLYPRN